MVTLEQIKNCIFDHYGVELLGDVPGCVSVKQVELAGPHTVFCGETLYLCPDYTVMPDDPECLAVIWEKPDDSRRLYLSTPMDPGALYQLIRELMDGEAELQEQINRLYGLLPGAGGLKAVIKTAEDYLGYPISVCDASYNLIETSPKMCNLAYGIQNEKSRLILDAVEIESLRRLQIERKIYENHGAFVVNSEDHPEDLWVFCTIRIQNVVAGYVAVCLPGEIQPQDRELRYITALADVCSTEMQKHDFFVTRTGMKYENFMVELLEGRFSSVNMISSRLELLDRKVCRFFCLAIFRCSEPHSSDLFNKRQMSTLRSVYPNSMSVVYQDAIVLFLNRDEPILLDEELLRPLREFAQRSRMKVGISQPFSDILKMNAYYQQSLNVLRIGELHDPAGTCYLATELLPQYLFSNSPYAGLEAGIHHHIFWLNDYDKQYHTDFIHTLRTYLECNRSAARAAEKLHLHRSTFFYRMKKLEELLGISLDDGKLLFLYELSFMMWDYLSK